MIIILVTTAIILATMVPYYSIVFVGILAQACFMAQGTAAAWASSLFILDLSVYFFSGNFSPL